MKVLKHIGPFAIFTLLFLFASCSPETKQGASPSMRGAAGPEDKKATLSSDAPEQKAPASQNADTGKKADSKPLVDPKTVQAVIQKEVTMVPSDLLTDSSWTFPQLSLDLKNAEYVKILRCNRSYEIQTTSGDILDPNKTSKFESDELKWAWSQAESDNRNCKIVSDYVATTTYTDLASPSGQYFYVINSCLGPQKTASKREECSYLMDMSEAFTFQSHFKEALREKALQLSKIETGLAAKLNRLRMLAENLKIAIRYCESFYATQETTKALQRGAIMAGIFIGAFTAGYFYGGGEPSKGIMFGQMGMMMGGQMLGQKLGLTQAENTCLGGTKAYEGYPAPTDPQQRKMLNDAVKAAKDLEEKFGVVDTFDKIEELTSQTGLIARDMAAMQNVMGEMSVMDQRVVAADAAIAKGTELATQKLNEAGPASPGAPPPGGGFDPSLLKGLLSP